MESNGTTRTIHRVHRESGYTLPTNNEDACQGILDLMNEIDAYAKGGFMVI